MVTTTRFRMVTHTLDLPADWEIDETADRLLVAVLPGRDESPAFAANLVVTVSGAPVRNPVDGLALLPGATLLSAEPFDGPFPAHEVVFGYATPAATVTAARVVAAHGAVFTFSAAATEFEDRWPLVRAAVSTWQERT